MTLSRKKEIGTLVFISLYSLLVFLFFLLLVHPQGQPGIFLPITFTFLALLWVALVQYVQAINYNAAGHGWAAFLVVAILFLVLGQFTPAAIVGSLLSLMFLFIGRSYLNRELKSRIGFHVWEIFSLSCRYTLLALAFGLVGMSFGDVQQRFNPNNVQIPEKYIQSIMQIATPIVGQLVHGFDPSKTVDQFLVDQAQEQNAKTGEGTEVPPGQLAIVRQQFSSQFGVPVTGQETLSDVTGGIINRYVQNWAKDNNLIFVGVVVILLFLAWRAIIPFFVVPSLLLVWLLLKFSLRIGLVNKVITTVSSERLQY